MLFKKTLKVASATALWMVALLGANSAMGLDFDDPQTATMNSPLVFSAEALEAAATDLGYNVTAAGLTGDTTLGTLAGLLARNSALYIRVDVHDVLALRDAPTLSTHLVASDGTLGAAVAVDNETDAATDQYLLYVVGPDGAFAGNTVLSMDFQDDLVVTGMGNGTVSMRAYDTIAGGLRGEGVTLFAKDLTLLTVASSVTVTGEPAAQTATVASNFTQFKGETDTAPPPGIVNLGGYTLEVNAAHLKPDGTATTNVIADANIAAGAEDGTGSFASFAGDGGFGFASSVAVHTTADCSDVGPPSPIPFPADADDPEVLIKTGPVAVAIAATGTGYLCATVAADNAATILEGDYTVDVSLGAVAATNPFPPQGAMGLAAGSIGRDGTTVHIPFVTSYEGYTQRIVIVNRNSMDVEFTLTFHAEGDGTADPMWYDGMAARGTSTVLKVADIVTLENPTRASATLSVVSTPAMIDVATTMVNKMDQSTDTVIVHLGRHNKSD